MLTVIEVAGSALVALLYLAILATVVTVKTRRKPAAKPHPKAVRPGEPGRSVESIRPA